MRGHIAKTVLLNSGGNLEYAGRTGEIVSWNTRLLRKGCFDDLRACWVRGNCLAPQVMDGDLLFVAHRRPKDGDIVMLEKEEQSFFQRYRCDGQNTWLESHHGTMPLDGCSIKGVVLAIGRFPSPTMDVGGVELVPIPILTPEHIIINGKGGNYERIDTLKR